jgi:hypothetical protein
MRQIIDAPINTIAINPYRRLHTYPYIESKIEALQRSIADVGLWPSVMARPLDGNQLWKYEQAFGHHRVEAARRSGLRTIPLIVDDLTDEQMLQYMGRENLEDYNAVFLIQLESWEAALKSGLAFGTPNKTPQAIDIARLLGWTRRASQGGHAIVNDTAAACYSAYALIEGGHMAREDFANLTVDAARLIAERAWARMQQIETVGKTQKQKREDIDEAKSHIAAGARLTAKQAREGDVSNNDLRGQVDVNSYEQAREAKKQSPLFAKFAKDAAKTIAKFINTDKFAEKLAQIQKSLDLLTLDDDKQALERLDYELKALGDRTGIWRKRLTPADKKVSRLQIS